MKLIRTLCVWAAFASCGFTSANDEFPTPVNTQAAGEHPPSPQEMLELFELPPGFKVTLFAGEPDVQQPICFDFDDTGRLWVAENYTYSAHGKIDPNLRDRIVILHDKDGDGQHDERKVFWDKGSMLTSLTWGYGGLWILNDGTLSFIPDKNGDDVPDSEPVEMLNGWTKNAGHNFVSGLMWGPDGWLYGRHGITDTSYPGTPDTPQAERPPINCGIWRFHPIKHTFEVVCHGTTNPWGLDYNEVGDMFMSNNVIGHLWHVIPGAHYERMFGQDFNPHCYELMGPISDHYHWDNTGKWSESRDGKADDLGGGHSHCGLMLYYGQNFPKEYWGKAFMCNTHGRCVNVDRIERKGSSYVAKHEPNFLKVNTPWFRGVQLAYGPAGCMYLSDWSDNGECHDHDGVHRTSGRIYRISYGEVKAQAISPQPETDSLARLASSALTGSEWTKRKSLRLLAERVPYVDSAEQDLIHREMTQLSGNEVANRRSKLTALQVLEVAGGLPTPIIEDLLQFEDDDLVAFILRQAIERGGLRAGPADPSRTFDMADSGSASTLLTLIQTTSSPRVLLTVASSLQKLDSRTRIMSAKVLVDRIAEFDDKSLELMAWYALSEETSPAALMYFASTDGVSPRLLQFAVRRIAQLKDMRELVLGELLSSHGPAGLPEQQVAVLNGLIEGYRGQLRPAAPNGWDKTQKRFMASGDATIIDLTRKVAVLFGDGAAIEDLRMLVEDRSGDHAARSMAVRALAEIRDKKTLPVLLSLLNDRAIYADVAKALAAFDDDPRIPAELLKRWDSLRHGAKEAAMDTMISRKSYAIELMKALNDGRVSGNELAAVQVRQLLAFNDADIKRIVEAKWGVINESSADKEARISELKQKLTADVLAAANLESGAALFKKSCAACHKLYGDGGQIGPDLTGGNRANMDYLLGNVVDPSAEVPRQFTVSVIALASGRVITGVVVGETNGVLTVQTDKEKMSIATADIEERTQTTKSLMPDGLLDTLTEEQVRDLFAFVMKRR
ncbi:MAG: PVC-type heme-binding CxxCH protein [Fuerstiella sp.]